MHADACVRPGTESQMVTWAPTYIEAVRVGVLALVTVCGPVEHDGTRARGQQHTVHVHVTGDVAGEVLDRRVVAQHFVDRARSQPRVLTHQLPLVRVVREQPNRVADGTDRGVQTGTHVVDHHGRTRLGGHLTARHRVVDPLGPTTGLQLFGYRLIRGVVH